MSREHKHKTLLKIENYTLQELYTRSEDHTPKAEIISNTSITTETIFETAKLILIIFIIKKYC